MFTTFCKYSVFILKVKCFRIKILLRRRLEQIKGNIRQDVSLRIYIIKVCHYLITLSVAVLPSV